MSSQNRITRAAVAVSSLALVACSSLLGGCGLLDGTTEAVVAVDSISIGSPAASGNFIKLTFHGYLGANSCSELARVDRRALAGDTLSWRFTARRGGGNCLQMPEPLRYNDSIVNLPARTMILRVEQPSGSPLLMTVQLPLTTAP